MLPTMQWTIVDSEPTQPTVVDITDITAEVEQVAANFAVMTVHAADAGPPPVA